MEKTRAQTNVIPELAPAFAAVATVPGPIKAAEIIDQKIILLNPLLNDINFGIFEIIKTRYKKQNPLK
jgi:hypothetical protein